MRELTLRIAKPSVFHGRLLSNTHAKTTPKIIPKSTFLYFANWRRYNCRSRVHKSIQACTRKCDHTYDALKLYMYKAETHPDLCLWNILHNAICRLIHNVMCGFLPDIANLRWNGILTATNLEISITQTSETLSRFVWSTNNHCANVDPRTLWFFSSVVVACIFFSFLGFGSVMWVENVWLDETRKQCCW